MSMVPGCAIAVLSLLIGRLVNFSLYAPGSDCALDFLFPYNKSSSQHV